MILTFVGTDPRTAQLVLLNDPDGAFTPITCLTDLWDAVGSQSFFRSSSIDFPHEYTTDQTLLDICQAVRENRWQPNHYQ